MFLYYVTRKGSRIAGSIAVPLETARLAVRALKHEHRGPGRDEYGYEIAYSLATAGVDLAASAANA